MVKTSLKSQIVRSVLMESLCAVSLSSPKPDIFETVESTTLLSEVQIEPSRLLKNMDCPRQAMLKKVRRVITISCFIILELEGRLGVVTYRIV
jgi:hypothetical protein